MPTPDTEMKLGLRIASRLRDEIIAGQLEAGMPLRLATLAERLGVSTTPVREALTILERQGLVSSQLNRGFRVAAISPREIQSIYSVHAHMSELLTETASRRMSEEDIDELERLDEQMREATARGDAALSADLNHEFHRRINLKAGLPILIRYLSETTPFVVRRGDPDLPGWADQRLEGHRAIIVALRQRDGAAAGELMGEHIRRSGDLARVFAEGSADQPDLADGRPEPRDYAVDVSSATGV
jgi:DNA-binding GntR family transcriptional regulator